jgi:predicted exporter
MKKMMLMALLWPVLLMAERFTLQEAPGRTTVYEKAPESGDRRLVPGRTLYYKSGDPAQPAEARDRVVVSFKTEPDLKGFMAEFDLTNPQRISRLYHSWRFDLSPGADPVAVSAAIAAQRTDLRYAKPEWIATNRRVK